MLKSNELLFYYQRNTNFWWIKHLWISNFFFCNFTLNKTYNKLFLEIPFNIYEVICGIHYFVKNYARIFGKKKMMNFKKIIFFIKFLSRNHLRRYFFFFFWNLNNWNLLELLSPEEIKWYFLFSYWNFKISKLYVTQRMNMFFVLLFSDIERLYLARTE